MYLSARNAYIALAIFLSIVLLGLITLLFMRLNPGALVSVGGDEEGGITPLLEIQGPGRGDNPLFSRPQGVALGPDGRIYVSDTDNNRIAVFSRDGRFLQAWGGFGVAKPLPGIEATWDEGELNFPLGIDVSDDEEVFVADFRNDQIQVFDTDGDFLRRFPDPTQPVGKGASGQDGLGIAVTDIAVDGEVVYALDSYQVVAFDTDGEFREQWGMPGAQEGGIDHPNGIDVGEDGTVYVSDSNNNRVTAFSPEGDHLWTVGEPVTQLQQQVDNEFGLPRGLCVRDDGSILVVDAFNHELVVLEREGEVRARYGDRGVNVTEFNFPNAVDDIDDRIAVADKENNRVLVLRLSDR